MKLIRKPSVCVKTIALPTRPPNTDQGSVTRSRIAWTRPLCLFVTNSAIAASLNGRQLTLQQQMATLRKLLTSGSQTFEDHGNNDCAGGMGSACNDRSNEGDDCANEEEVPPPEDIG